MQRNIFDGCSETQNLRRLRQGALRDFHSLRQFHLPRQLRFLENPRFPARRVGNLGGVDQSELASGAMPKLPPLA